MNETIVLIYHVTVFNRKLSEGDAQFSKDQYVLVMYLMEQTRSGRPLPARLPDELVPPSLRAKLPAAATAAWQPGAAPGSRGPPSVATAAGPQATSPSAPKPQPQPAAQLPSAPPVKTAMLTPADGMGPGVAGTGAPTIGTGVASVGVGVPQAELQAAAGAPNYEALSTLSGESAFASEVSRADAGQRLIEERRRGLDAFYEEERRARQKHNEEETERQRKRLEAIRLREYVSRNRLLYMYCMYEYVCDPYLWFAFCRENERRLEEERVRTERLSAVVRQLETLRANEIAAHQQAVCARQKAQVQTDAFVRRLLLKEKRMPEPHCFRLYLNVYYTICCLLQKARKDEFTRLLEKQKAGNEWLRDAQQRENLLKAEVSELSQQLEVLIAQQRELKAEVSKLEVRISKQ